MRPGLRDLAALTAAVAACIAVTVVGAPPTAPAAADPGTLAGAWPHATPFDMPGFVSGDAYQPLAVTGRHQSIGTATSPDGTTVSLVLLDTEPTPAAVRVVQAGLAARRVSFDAFAATAADIYFMRSTADAHGYGHESLWRLPRTGATPTLMTGDAGDLSVQGSVNDLQIAAGTLRWIATDPTDPARTQLRAIPLSGGPVHARALDGRYQLTTYPMMFSGQADDPPTPTLTDSMTGTITTVHTAAQAATFCDPTWCVMQTSDDSGANEVQLAHPDGTGLRHLGDADTSLVTADPTLAGRYVALTEQSPAMAAAPSPTAELWLYDTRTRRSVEITGAASKTFGAGGWLWWSTGDNQTLTWHALDLTTLH
jgi:hypothetical protein